MDFSNIFRLVNLAVGAVMVLGGISQFIQSEHLFRDIIIGIYVIIFGLVVAGLELLPQVPPYIPKYASFMFSFLGRGIFYVFVGCLILEGKWPRIVAGSIIGLIGVGYCALEFLPQIEPPSNMRDADAGWGAEQV